MQKKQLKLFLMIIQFLLQFIWQNMPVDKEKQREKFISLRIRMNKESSNKNDIKRLHLYKNLAWIDPHNIEYFQNYAAVLLRLGQVEKGQVLLVKHIEYPSPEMKEKIYLQYLKHQIKQQRYEKAFGMGVKYLSKVKKRQVSSEFMRTTAKILQICHQLPLFCEISTRLVNRYEKKEGNFITAMAAHFMIKQYQKVLYYSQEMKAYWEPNYIGVYMAAISHYEQRELQKCLKALDQCIEMEPRWKVSRFHYIILTISQIPWIGCEQFVGEIVQEINSHLNILKQQISKQQNRIEVPRNSKEKMPKIHKLNFSVSQINLHITFLVNFFSNPLVPLTKNFSQYIRLIHQHFISPMFFVRAMGWKSCPRKAIKNQNCDAIDWYKSILSENI